MFLLLCAATEFEIAPTLRFLEAQQLFSKVSVLITGVGLPSATYKLTKEIGNKPPSVILQAGLAGSLSKDFPLTEVVAVEKDCFGDLGVEEHGTFQTLFDMKLCAADQVPWQGRWLVNPHRSLLQTSGLVTVSACSVNEISTDESRIEHYRQTGAAIESMEGAAMHYVALMEDMPFLQLRAISNYAGERDKTKWAMQQSITRLNEELQRIILKLISA